MSLEVALWLFGGCAGVITGLLAVIWGMVKARDSSLSTQITELKAQVTNVQREVHLMKETLPQMYVGQAQWDRFLDEFDKLRGEFRQDLATMRTFVSVAVNRAHKSE